MPLSSEVGDTVYRILRLLGGKTLVELQAIEASILAGASEQVAEPPSKVYEVPLRRASEPEPTPGLSAKGTSDDQPGNH